MKILNPSGIAAPVGSYSHAIETPPGARILHISGQVGIDAAGVPGTDFRGGFVTRVRWNLGLRPPSPLRTPASAAALQSPRSR